MTFLKEIPEISCLKISVIRDKMMLKQFIDIPSYEDRKEIYDSIEDDVLNDLFSIFVAIIKDPTKSEISNLTVNYLVKTEYKFEDEEDEEFFNCLAALLYYIQYCFENNKTLFESIGLTNNEYNLLIENNYNIHNEKDMKELMSYFWNIKFNFRMY